VVTGEEGGRGVLLFLDGLDKTGKTIFAQAWVATYPAQWRYLVWHYPALSPPLTPEFFVGSNYCILQAYANFPEAHWLINRSLIAEKVYGQLVRRNLDESWLKWWVAQLPAHTGALYFTVPYEVYQTRYRGDDAFAQFSPGQWDLLGRDYRGWLEFLHIPHLVVDGTAPFATQHDRVYDWLYGPGGLDNA
jgi:thymidylate kinase